MLKASAAGQDMVISIAAGEATMEEFEVAATAAQTSVNGLAIAQASLNMALTLGIAIVLPKIIQGVNDLIHARKNAYEEAKKASSEAKSEFNDMESESQKLDELITKYKELANGNTDDVNTRKEIRDVQDSIVSLVGQQANSLDLVNGKLDEQIQKLETIRSIEAQGVLDKANVAYHEALDAENSAIASRSHGLVDGLIYYRDKSSKSVDDEIVKFLNNSGYYRNTNFDPESHYYAITDTYDKNGKKLSGAVEKLAIIEQMINDIEASFGGDYLTSDLYNALVAQRDIYSQIKSETEAQLKSVIDKTLTMSEYDSELSQLTVDSAQTFDEYRQALIDKVKDNDNVAIAIANGRLSEDDLISNIDSYLNTSSAFSDFYREWKTLQVRTEQISTILGGYVGDNTESSKDDFVNWLSGMSESDLDIVYKISTEYTGGDDPDGKVATLLKAYSEGGSVDLTLRPKIDPEELRKAGWDADGNAADGDYATVFTGTYYTADKSRAINLTPILTDDKGNYVGVLTPEELEDYANRILDGADDVKGLQIGAEFKKDDIEDAAEKASKAAKDIHLAEDFFYDIGDPNKSTEAMQRAMDAWYNTYITKHGIDAFNSLLNDKGTEKDPHFIDRVDKYLDRINKLDDAYKKISENKFEDDDFNKLIRDFPTLATRADDLTVAISELKAAMNEDIEADFAAQFDKMDTEDDVAALEAWRDAVLSIGEAVDEATSLFTGDNSRTQKILSEASKVQAVLNSQKNGQSISLEDFNADEFKDYKEALEYVNGAVQLNKEKVVEITKAKAKEQIAINKSNKAMSQAKYLENARQITILRKSLEGARTEQEKFNYQTRINELNTENENIIDVCKQYDFLSKSLQEATDSYQHWLNIQSASDYGDMMSDTESAIKLISDTLDETSDLYGQVGSKKYQAALDLIIPDNIDHDSATAVKQYVDNLKKYFYFDENGAIAGMDIQGFIQKALNAGLMTFDSANQEYKIAGGKTMESFAEGLKLSSGMVQAFFDEMQLYGGKFDWSDEIGKSIDELYAEIEDLNSLPHFKDITLKLDFTDISTAEGRVKAIDEEIEKIDAIKATPNIDSSELQYANDILVYLTEQKQQLTAPAIMNVDTSKLDGEYQEIIELAQEYQSTLNTKELYAIKGIDTDKLDDDLSEIQNKLAQKSTTIMGELNFTDTSKDGILTFIKNFDPNKDIKTVYFKANTEEVDEARERASEPISTSVIYETNTTQLDLIERRLEEGFRTRVSVEVEDIDGDIDVPKKAQGTAHAGGTAKIGGDWGTSEGGKTLVGELGREIVVDPRTGRWYTVGDNGAQFVNIPKGSIVFNHIQSKSLLENGYVSGRASALASGTALVTGHIGLPEVQASTARKNRIAAEIAKATASELSDSTPDGGEKTEDSFKYIDRVEILLDRIHRKINAVKDAISDTFSLWSTRGDNITKQIRNITDEIDTQQAAARRYLEEARKQIDKYNLDPEWAKSLETGNIGFIYLTNLDELHEGYQEYLKWYEKYLDCRDSIAGLERDLSQLYKDQFDNIKKNYENQINLNEYLRDAEEKTFTKSTEYFGDMRSVYSKNLKLLTEEAKGLEKQLQKAVDSDAVEVGSEAWQDMQKDINSVTKEIAKTRIELKQLYIDQFDYIQSNYQNQLSLYGHYANVYNKKQKLLETQGYMTSSILLNEQSALQQRNYSMLKDELSSLQEEYNAIMSTGEIERYSEKWYELTEKINSVKEALMDVRTEIEDIENSKEDLEKSGFSLRQSLVSDLKDESDFYSNLMSFVDLYNKKGQLTDAGLATLGLYNYNVDVNKAIKEGYDTEIARIDEKYADDPYNTKYLEYRRELIKSRQESIIAIEDEEKAMISMVENGIDIELNSLKELIQTYKDSIDAAKTLYDYQKSIAEKSKNVAEIQKQLSAYSNDTSEETKATIQRLKVSLEEAQKDLAESEYAQMITDQKKLLDEMYDEYEKFLNGRLDDRDALLNDLKNAVNTIPDEIGKSLSDVANTVGIPLSETMSQTWGQAARNIEDWNKTHTEDQQITKQALVDSAKTWGEFGTNLNIRQDNLNDMEGKLVTATNNNTQGINRIWGDIDKIGFIDNPHSNINNNLTAISDVIKGIEKNVKAIMDEANNHLFSQYLGDVDFDESITAADALKILRASVGLEELNGVQKALADIDGDGSITSSDALIALRMSTGIEDPILLQDILDKLQAQQYATGGLNEYTGLAVLHGTKSKPELVLNSEDTQNFIKLKDILREAIKSQGTDLFNGSFGVEAPTLQLAKMPSLISGASTTNQAQDINIINNIEIDHVEDYDDFVSKLRTDPKFENMITTMTIGKLNGGRSIDKYKYRW